MPRARTDGDTIVAAFDANHPACEGRTAGAGFMKLEFDPEMEIMDIPSYEPTDVELAEPEPCIRCRQTTGDSFFMCMQGPLCPACYEAGVFCKHARNADRCPLCEDAAHRQMMEHGD